MTNFSGLRMVVSRALRDPDNDTFDVLTIGDFINSGLAEIGRLAPQRFMDDITPVADTLSYRLRSSVFSTANPDVEVVDVEFWDKTTTPYRALFRARPQSAEYTRSSDAGWRVWNGELMLTAAQANFLDPDRHVIRVWGYSPYPPLVNDGDTVPLTNALEQALITLCEVNGLQSLSLSRDLYTQWQGQPSNSDVSPASLLSALSLARDNWRRESRAISIIRA